MEMAKRQVHTNLSETEEDGRKIKQRKVIYIVILNVGTIRDRIGKVVFLGGIE